MSQLKDRIEEIAAYHERKAEAHDRRAARRAAAGLSYGVAHIQAEHHRRSAERLRVALSAA